MGLYADYLFPPLLDFLMSRPRMLRDRARALDGSFGEVLEIGFGTGLNLPYYPEAVERLVVLDPATMLKKRVARRISAARMPVEVAHLDAAELPFDAGRFDCVVTTWTLCTIEKVTDALSEIKRVLKPGGRYYFLEHGRSEDPDVARRQDRWNPLQRVIGVGCNLNRPIDRLVREAGLEIESLERYLMPKTPRIAAEHYRGYAVKS